MKKLHNAIGLYGKVYSTLRQDKLL